MSDLADKALKGDRRAIARLISLVEREDEAAIAEMKTIHRHARGVPVIGVTGVAGGGKSTLISLVAREYLRKGKRVGIIAIDPTSPFTGGALLGDRVRMSDISTDEGAFIRSMGTRGAAGGLACAVFDAVWILDACGFDMIFVETVGVGQDEVDVVRVADTTVVILVPGLGDYVQTIKAGIMEIGDILVVNKADVPGVEQIVAELEAMLDLGGRESDWQPPIVRTIARQGDGVAELVDRIAEHRKYLEDKVGADMLRRMRLEGALVEYVKARLVRMVHDEFDVKGRARAIVDRLVRMEIDPHTAADEIMEEILNQK